MYKFVMFSLGLVMLLGAAFLGGQSSFVAASESKLLEFDSMAGLPAAYTGSQNPIRGINGGGLAWDIGPTFGELKENGDLEISIHSLVFAAGPNTGSNTIPSFRAIVSCRTNDGGVMNVITDSFPATLGAADQGGGNAEIEATLELPQPCIAPIVFVTSPGGAWFASTGN